MPASHRLKVGSRERKRPCAMQGHFSIMDLVAGLVANVSEVNEEIQQIMDIYF